MAITYNTGATATPGGTQASTNITIPSGVQGRDFVLLHICLFTVGGAPIPISSVTSTGTALTQVTGSPQTSQSLFITEGSYYFVAAGAAGSPSSDAGKVITVTPASAAYTSLALAAWTGASTSAPDVSGGNAQTSGAGVTSWAVPTLTTGVSGDWGIYCCSTGVNASGVTVPAGTTQRVQANGNGGVVACIADSNGSVGNSGTSIGGGTYTGSSTNNWTGFTIGLAPASTAHTATVSLTVTPTLTVAKTGSHPRTAALTVSPARTIAKTMAHVRSVTPTVRPAVTLAETMAHVRSVTPVVRPAVAIAFKGPQHGGGTDRHHHRGSR